MRGLLLLFLLTGLCGACRLGPRGAWVMRGQAALPAADAEMRRSGARFAGYSAPGEGDIDAERDRVCADGASEAARAALTTRYSLNPEAPRYAIRVVDASCTAVTAETNNSRLSRAMRGDEYSIRAEVRLAITDLSSGEVVLEILGRETSRELVEAIRGASRKAADKLYGGGQ
jgi:hypothetical protein